MLLQQELGLAKLIDDLEKSSAHQAALLKESELAKTKLKKPHEKETSKGDNQLAKQSNAKLGQANNTPAKISCGRLLMPPKAKRKRPPHKRW